MAANNVFLTAPTNLDLSLPHLRQSPECAIKAMVTSLEKRGQLNPIIVGGDKKHMILVDGFKRQQAAQIIGMKEISVLLLSLNGPNMKSHVYLLNRNKGFSFIEECVLIRELVEVDGIIQSDVAIMLERHKSWVSRRLAMYLRLDREIIENVRLGLLPTGSVSSLARLQQCNQVDMAAAIIRDQLKISEIKRLVNLWFKADTPEKKQFILSSSQEALELSSIIDSKNKIDAHIPINVRSWLKILQTLKLDAVKLKQRSIQQSGEMNNENKTILLKAFEDAKCECEEAIKSAHKILSQKEGIMHASTS